MIPMLPSQPPPGTVHDPICGMDIAPEDAAETIDWNGERIYFCNPGCARKFREQHAGGTGKVTPAPPPKGTPWTCPMHPEIVRDGPGSCPICGMALEPKTVTLDDANPELEDMTRRFGVSLAFTVPLLLLGMSELLPGMPVHRALGRWLPLIELALATPVV